MKRKKGEIINQSKWKEFWSMNGLIILGIIIQIVILYGAVIFR